MKGLFISFVFIQVLVLLGCSSEIPPELRQTTRNEIDSTSVNIIDSLSEEFLDIPEELAYSSGYAAISMTRVQAPILGGGVGSGAIYSNTDNRVTYIDVTSYEIGAGLAYEDYKALIIFDSKKALNDYRSETWNLSLGSELTFSGNGAYSTTMFAGEKDISIYLLNTSGASALGGIRAISSTVNYDLTKTGLSESGLPNRNTNVVRNDAVPNQWSHMLPFFAQSVVDKGYTLPKPIGVSLIYTSTFQYMDITELEVGINGSKRYPIDFVSFSNNNNNTESPQLKLDAWLFPFMNVFGTVGKIDGTADIGISISGDDLVQQLAADCSGRLKPPVCFLRGRQIEGTVTAELAGTNYTFGTVLAYGWNNYFLTLPVSFTYADMRKNDAEGVIVNISPRLGRVFPLSGTQSIAVYSGATYLDSSLTLTGTYTFEGIDIDYKVKQSNVDKWAGLIGANYNFNHDWSFLMEYGWKLGRKHQFVSGLTRRF